jgi:hypothetical protein
MVEDFVFEDNRHRIATEVLYMADPTRIGEWCGRPDRRQGQEIVRDFSVFSTTTKLLPDFIGGVHFATIEINGRVTKPIKKVSTFLKTTMLPYVSRLTAGIVY